MFAAPVERRLDPRFDDCLGPRESAFACWLSMGLRIVRLGTGRHPKEGLRIGTVRRPPRGVPRAEFASRDYYDVWLPDLAPSPTLFSWAVSEPFTDARWKRFAREYRKEMRTPSATHLIALLAALSQQTNLSVG